MNILFQEYIALTVGRNKTIRQIHDSLSLPVLDWSVPIRGMETRFEQYLLQYSVLHFLIKGDERHARKQINDVAFLAAMIVASDIIDVLSICRFLGVEELQQNYHKYYSEKLPCSTLFTLGHFFRISGWFSVAKRYLEGAKKEMLHQDQEGAITTNHISILDQLALLYKDVGSYDDALENFLCILERYGNHLKEDSDALVITKRNIANIYVMQGKLHQAQEIFESILQPVDNMSDRLSQRQIVLWGSYLTLQCKLGLYTESIQKYSQLIDIVEEQGKENDTQRISLYNNVANIYHKLENMEKAFFYYKKSMSLSLNLLGPRHPTTLKTQVQVASMLMNQKKYHEALQMFETVNLVMDGVWQKNHPDRLTTINQLGKLYFASKQYQKSEVFITEIYELSKQKYGEESPNTITLANNLASIYAKTNRFKESLYLFNIVIAYRERTLGTQHPSTRIVKSNLGSLFLQSKQYDAAEEVFGELLEIEKEELQQGKTKVLSSVKWLLHIYEVQQKSSLSLLEHTTSLYEEFLGTNHKTTIVAKYSLGWMYYEKNHQHAIEIFGEIVNQDIEQSIKLASKCGLALFQDRKSGTLSKSPNVYQEMVDAIGDKNEETKKILLKIQELTKILGR